MSTIRRHRNRCIASAPQPPPPRRRSGVFQSWELVSSKVWWMQTGDTAPRFLYNERTENHRHPRTTDRAVSCAFLVYLQINLFIPGRKVASIYFQHFRDTIRKLQEDINWNLYISLGTSENRVLWEILHFDSIKASRSPHKNHIWDQIYR